MGFYSLYECKWDGGYQIDCWVYTVRRSHRIALIESIHKSFQLNNHLAKWILNRIPGKNSLSYSQWNSYALRVNGSQWLETIVFLDIFLRPPPSVLFLSLLSMLLVAARRFVIRSIEICFLCILADAPILIRTCAIDFWINRVVVMVVRCAQCRCNAWCIGCILSKNGLTEANYYMRLLNIATDTCNPFARKNGGRGVRVHSTFSIIKLRYIVVLHISHHNKFDWLKIDGNVLINFRWSWINLCVRVRAR